MSEASDKPVKGFHFLPVYADLIASAANRWAYLEYYVNCSIWLLADVKPAIGACLTSQMYTLNSKLSALLSLLKLRKADTALIDKVNKFASSVRDALDARNRDVHDIWLNDNINKDQMGKLRITADKVLRFHIDEVKSDALVNDNEIIERRRVEAGEIMEAIKAALPSLPEMSHTDLHPITETPVVP